MATQRIEYIDAMRGFTMILVVYAHVLYFCLDGPTMGFNRIFYLFRLPCFFFISGWLFESVSCRPFLQVVRRKFMVQIVPTFIFLFLLAPPPEFFHQLGTLKGGYWFTFVLFVFFVIYLLSVRLCHRWCWLVALVVSVASFIYASWMNHLRVASPDQGLLSGVLDVMGFLSVPLWRFYIFFYIGTLVRRHFETFVRYTDLRWVVLMITVCFLAISLTPHPASPVLEYLRFSVGGILGMFMVFVFFRHSYSRLQRLRLSAPLQYVGTRTLDIYLLHYFFLPRFLMPYGEQLRAYDCQFLEFLVVMVVALIVLALSLLASYVIRLSPFLGHYLFGVNRP